VERAGWQSHWYSQGLLSLEAGSAFCCKTVSWHLQVLGVAPWHSHPLKWKGFFSEDISTG